jgi:two-component system OmpR family response regulator
MTMACLCEVDRPGLAAALAIRGVGVQRTRRAAIATLRPPAGSVLVAGLSAGDLDWIDLRRTWHGALMVLIAGGDQAALAAALDAGADDAVSDRADDMLIAARTAALARRRGWSVLRVGSLEIDPVARTATRSGRPLALLPREYAVLLMLAEANGAVVSRAALRDHVLGRRFETGTNVVEVHLSRLRTKLDRGSATPLIVTERGRGYRLVADDAPIAVEARAR